MGSHPNPVNPIDSFSCTTLELPATIGLRDAKQPGGDQGPGDRLRDFRAFTARSTMNTVSGKVSMRKPTV